MRKRRFLVTAFLIVLVIVILESSAFAYNLKPFQWPGSSYPITVTYSWGDRLQTPGTVIRSGFESALSSWNGAQSKISLSYNSNSSSILNSYYLSSSSEYGYITYSYIGSTLYSFLAYVNAGNTHITESNVARSAACHELGHGGMTLYEENTQTAIMNQTRDRTVIYIPQTDDITGVNTQYP